MPGLEALAQQEIRQRLPGARIVRVDRGFDERISVIFIQWRGAADDLLGLGLTEDVFALALTTGIPTGWGGLRVLRDAVAAGPMLESAAMVAGDVQGRHLSRPTFRVIARMAGEHAFRRVDAQHAVESGIGDAFPRWHLVEDGSQLEFWLQVTGGRVTLAARLSDQTMRAREYKNANLPASLKPTIARAMALLTEPAEDDIFLDPMCGAGTILIERAMTGRYRELLGGDSDPAAVAAALDNIGPRYKPVSVRRWDARALPLEDGSVSRIATNLPFGKQVGSPQENRTLYPALLAEWVRVLRPGGRMVLLTGDVETLQRALHGRREMVSVSWSRLLVRGLPARLWALRRV